MCRSKLARSILAALSEKRSRGLANLLQCHGVGEPTFVDRLSKYAGASVPDSKRLCELKVEHCTLNRMHTDLALVSAAINDVRTRQL